LEIKEEDTFSKLIPDVGNSLDFTNINFKELGFILIPDVSLFDENKSNFSNEHELISDMEFTSENFQEVINQSLIIGESHQELSKTLVSTETLELNSSMEESHLEFSETLSSNNTTQRRRPKQENFYYPPQILTKLIADLVKEMSSIEFKHQRFVLREPLM